jgi:hypothetical protein
MASMECRLRGRCPVNVGDYNDCRPMSGRAGGEDCRSRLSARKTPRGLASKGGRPFLNACGMKKSDAIGLWHHGTIWMLAVGILCFGGDPLGSPGWWCPPTPKHASDEGRGKKDYLFLVSPIEDTPCFGVGGHHQPGDPRGSPPKHLPPPEFIDIHSSPLDAHGLTAGGCDSPRRPDRQLTRRQSL